jgi:tetratricopeptide (TPR) repeat protein
MELQSDGTVFVHQQLPVKKDTYTLVFQSDMKGIRGLRLETFPDSRILNGGSGWGGDGNFVLNEVTLHIAPTASPDQVKAIGLKNAAADFSQVEWNVRGLIDGVDSTGWAVSPETKKEHSADFELAEEVGDGEALRLTVRLKHLSNDPNYVMGRFRLSVSSDPATFERDQKRYGALKVSEPWAKLAAAYHVVGDQSALDRLLRSHPTAAIGIGDLFASNQDWERAIAGYSKALTSETNDADLFAKRAEAYEKLGQWEPAIVDWGRADELVADKNKRFGNYPSLIRRAQAYDRLRRSENALADYSRAVDESIGGLDALIWRSDHWAQRGEWKQAAGDYRQLWNKRQPSWFVEWYYARVRALLNLAAGDNFGYRDAVAEFSTRAEKIVDADSSRWLPLVLVATPEMVTDSNRDQLAAASEHSDVWWKPRLQAALLFRSGKIQQAADLFDQNPGGTAFPFLAAMANYRLQRLDRARQLFDEGNASIQSERDKDPGCGAGVPRGSWWGDWLVSLQLQREAARLLAGRELTELDAVLASAKLEIVKAEYGAGTLQKDVTDLVRKRFDGAQLIPLPSPSYNVAFGGDPAPSTSKQLKIQYRINDRPAEAAFAENTPIILPITDTPRNQEPEIAVALLKRAILLAKYGLYDEALSDLRQITPPPTDPADFLALRGRVLAQLHLEDEALGDLNQAIADQSNDALVYAARARILKSRGAIEQARTDLEKSLEIEPTGQAARQVSDLLLDPNDPRNKVLAPTSEQDAADWRYTFTRPADDWMAEQFDDATWQQGKAGFGGNGSAPGLVIRTPWTTSDVWLRRTFEWQPDPDMQSLFLRITHDDGFELFINGQKMISRQDWSPDGYVSYPLDAKALNLLKPGTNTLAVHCSSTVGAQYIDIGLHSTPFDPALLQQRFEALKLTDPWLKLASAYALSGRHSDSSHYFRRALQLADGFEARKPILESASRFDEVLRDLSREQPDDLQLQLARARRLAQRGKQRLADQRPDEAQADLEKSREIFRRLRGLAANSRWTVLKPVEMVSRAGAQLELLKDGSVFVQQTEPGKTDSYLLKFSTKMKGLIGLRLESLADARLPVDGSGWQKDGGQFDGNFVVSELSLQVPLANSPAQTRTIALRNPWADFNQSGWEVRGALDGNANTGWAVAPEQNQDHTAVFELAEDVGDGTGSSLFVRLNTGAPFGTFLLGRFRLSFTNDAATLLAMRVGADLNDVEVADQLVALAKARAQHGSTSEVVAVLTEALAAVSGSAAKSLIIRAAAHLTGVLDQLAERAAADGLFQAELSRYFAEEGQTENADAARAKARTLLEQQLTAEPGNTKLASELADVMLSRNVLRLGRQNRVQGLDLLDFEAEGVTVPAEVDGEECRTVQRLPAGWAQIYFAIDKSFKWAPRMDVQVEVDYWDDASGSFLIQYDAHDNAYRNSSETIQLKGTNQWQRARFILKDARLANSQNAKADFRLLVSGSDIRFRSVSVRPLIGDPWTRLGAGFVLAGDNRRAADLLASTANAAAISAWLDNGFSIDDVLEELQTRHRDRLAALLPDAASAAAQRGQIDQARSLYERLVKSQRKNRFWQERIDQLQPGVLALWNFDTGPGSWRQASDCGLAVEKGVLTVRTTGGDPQFSTPIGAPAGGLTLALRYRTEKAFTMQIFWSNTAGSFDEARHLDYQLPAAAGEWREAILPFPTQAALASLRLDPNTTSEHPLEIAFIKLRRFELTDLEMMPADGNLSARRAGFLAAAGLWDAARADWLRAVELQPDLAQSAIDTFKQANRWNEAAEMANLVISQKPKEYLEWLKVAPLFVLAGDQAVYRSFCDRMVKQFAANATPAEAEGTVKACLLQSGAIDLDRLPARALGDFLDTGAEPGWLRVYAWAARALWAYRSGDGESAVKYVAKSEELKPDDYIRAMNLAVLALAEHQLKHADAARRALAEAVELTDRLESDPAKKGHHDLLIAQILVREAQAVMTGDSRDKREK